MKFLLFCICIYASFFCLLFSVQPDEVEMSPLNSITLCSGKNRVDLDKKTLEPYIKKFCEELGKNYTSDIDTLRFNDLTQKELESIKDLLTHMHQQISNPHQPITFRYKQEYLKNHRIFKALMKVFQQKNQEAAASFLKNFMQEIKRKSKTEKIIYSSITVLVLVTFLFLLVDILSPLFNISRKTVIIIQGVDTVALLYCFFNNILSKNEENYIFLKNIGNELNILPLENPIILELESYHQE